MASEVSRGYYYAGEQDAAKYRWEGVLEFYPENICSRAAGPSTGDGQGDCDEEH